MKDILCCTVLYDDIKSKEKKISLNLMQIKTKINDTLIIDDYKRNKIGKFKGCVIKKNENGLNPVELREYCIKYALNKGYKYFLFIDADDIQLHNKISFLYESINEKQIDFVSHNLTIVNEENEILKYKMFPKIKDFKIDLNILLKKNMIGLGNTIFNTQRLVDCLPLKDNVICDWWIALNLIINGAKGVLIDDVLSYYVQHGNNTANIVTMNKESITKEYNIKICMYEELRKKYSNKSNKYNHILAQLDAEEKAMKQKYSKKKDQPILQKMNYWWDLLND